MPRTELEALLKEEEAARRDPLMRLSPPAVGNPVMDSLQSAGFQITPEEMAVDPQGNRGRAFGEAAISALLGGTRQAVPAYHRAMVRSQGEAVTSALQGPYDRLLSKEGRTRQDFNEFEAYRSKLTGTDPRFYMPPNLQTNLREMPVTENGVERRQLQFVSIDPETGEIVNRENYGSSYARTPKKALSDKDWAQFANTVDARVRWGSGQNDDQIMDLLRALDPEHTIDENDPQAMTKALLSRATKSSDPYAKDLWKTIREAYKVVPGDRHHSNLNNLKKSKAAFEERIFDIWRKNEYGETREEAEARQATEAAAAAEANRKAEALAGQGGTQEAQPSAGSRFNQFLSMFGGDPYARQPAARTLPASAAPAPATPVVRGAPRRIAGVPFEGGKQVIAALSAAAPHFNDAMGNATRRLNRFGNTAAETLSPAATSLNEWPGPARASEALKRSMQTYNEPMPLSQLMDDARVSIGNEFNPPGRRAPPVSFPQPNIMPAIRDQLMELDLMVEEARKDEGRGRRVTSATKKAIARKKSALERALQEVIEGGPTRRAGPPVSERFPGDDRIMPGIRRGLTTLGLAASGR